MERVHSSTIKEGQNISMYHRDGKSEKTKIKELHVFDGMGRKKVQEVQCRNK